MKRIFQRKVKLASYRASHVRSIVVDHEHASQDAFGSSRTSATVLGLALSVAASGLVFHQHDNQAAAAELPIFPSSIEDFQALQEFDQEFDQSNFDGLEALQSIATDQSPRSAAVRSSSSPSKHIVREGDTLWSISRAYRIQSDKLAAINNLSTDSVLQIGQALDVPSNNQVLSEHQSLHQDVDVQPVSSNRNLAHLQMRKIVSPEGLQGDESDSPVRQDSTFADSSDVRSQAIARLRLRREQLQASLSGIQSESLIASPSVEEIEASQTSAELARALSSDSDASIDWSTSLDAPDGSIPSKSGQDAYDVTTHQIEPGETLAAIAREYGVPLQSIAEANSISNPNRVFAGQTIRIPTGLPADSDDNNSAGISTSSSELVQETLVGALPADHFGIESDRLLSTAPLVPIPVSPSDNLGDLDGDEYREGDKNVEISDIESTISTEETEPLGEFDAVESDSVSQEPIEDERLDSESSSVVYVENLIGDIEEISQAESSSSERAILEELDRLSQEMALNSSYRPDQEYIERGHAINPEFQAEPVQDASDDGLESSELVSDSDEQLLAAAPLGSANYIPLNQPVTGRMVSPDLPPLPGAENYLPSSEATFNGYLWPARGILTSGYGWRWGRMHQGIDIAAPVGTPIYAAAPGVIEFSGWNSGGYGNMVDIRHPDGSKTRYAHNSRNLVQVGQSVTQGQQIAEMGSTGYSTGPHVHFEIHKPDTGVVNPVAYLPSR